IVLSLRIQRRNRLLILLFSGTARQYQSWSLRLPRAWAWHSGPRAKVRHMSSLITFYLSTLAILAPLLACAGIGVYWGVRKLPISNDFITILVTSFGMPALVFQTLYSTQLDDSTLFDVGVSAFLSMALMGLVIALILHLMKLPMRALWLVT